MRGTRLKLRVRPVIGPPADGSGVKFPNQMPSKGQPSLRLRCVCMALTATTASDQGFRTFERIVLPVKCLVDRPPMNFGLDYALLSDRWTSIVLFVRVFLPETCPREPRLHGPRKSRDQSRHKSFGSRTLIVQNGSARSCVKRRTSALDR